MLLTEGQTEDRYCAVNPAWAKPATIRAFCSASRCMMWRWEKGWEEVHPEIRKGYCGLAGKPE